MGPTKPRISILLMRRRKWTEATLEEWRKGDAEKVKIAVRLREETLVTVA